MKLAARTLKKAIQAFKATQDPEKRAQIAMKWFEQNAEITHEEMLNHMREEM